MKKRATLADVAAAAGVSKMTASRALRRAADVSPSSLEKVHQAARDIGYVGNHLAMSLSNQRSDLIGVVIPTMRNIVFSEVLSGIATGIEGSGLQPVFGVTEYDPEKEYDVIRNMLSWNPVGLIVTGLDQAIDAKRLLEASEVPVVQIMDLDGTPVDACVGLSHRAAGADMARALIQAGRKRFGYVGCGLDRDTRAQKRLAGFRDTLLEAGLYIEAQVTEADLSTIGAGRSLTMRILKDHPKLDCLYYSNDDVAAGGAFHCIAHNIDVPDDLLLAGFNGLDFVQSLPVKIATMQTPRHDIGEQAARIILDAKRDGPLGERIAVTPKIIL